MNSKWLIAVLVASVAVNLMLGGFIAGRGFGFDPRGSAPAFDPIMGLTRALRFLPDERRQEVMGDRADRRQLISKIRGMRQSQRTVVDAIAAEPFDSAALDAALTEFRDTLGDVQMQSHSAFLGMIERLTPEERLAMVETLRQRDKRRSGERRPPGAGRPPGGRPPGAGPLMDRDGAMPPIE